MASADDEAQAIAGEKAAIRKYGEPARTPLTGGKDSPTSKDLKKTPTMKKDTMKKESTLFPRLGKIFEETEEQRKARKAKERAKSLRAAQERLKNVTQARTSGTSERELPFSKRMKMLGQAFRDARRADPDVNK